MRELDSLAECNESSKKQKTAAVEECDAIGVAGMCVYVEREAKRILGS